MPSLSHLLSPNDPGFLRIVAELWGVELTNSDPQQTAVDLGHSICDAELLEEIVSTLPEGAQDALGTLADAGGAMLWIPFTRRFGQLRDMGPGRRDREQPHRKPASVTEQLWYRALLGKAFLETPEGLQEFAYIPDELREALELIGFSSPQPATPAPQQQPSPTAAVPPPAALAPKPPASPTESETLGRPASPVEKAAPIESVTHLLDDACTLLAALRLGTDCPALETPEPVVQAFLEAAGITTRGVPKPEAVKSFLEAPRPAALEQLRGAWEKSDTFNELRQLPGLTFEGTWQNNPLSVRQFFLNQLNAMPVGQWWSMAAFVRDLKTRHADFQRPAPGDYDTWFIRRDSDNTYLRGFAHWESVDGALARYLITGPLFWLGLVELAAPEAGGAPSAFKRRETNAEPVREDGKLYVASNGRISVPRLAPRAVRYQITRFCVWDTPKGDEYRYRVTANALARAAAQGLKASQLLALLTKHSETAPPPAFVKSLQRWERNGTEAKLETLSVLRVSSPDVLEELRKSKAARFLGEIIGPTTVVIPAGAMDKILSALSELGLLAQDSSPE